MAESSRSPFTLAVILPWSAPRRLRDLLFSRTPTAAVPEAPTLLPRARRLAVLPLESVESEEESDYFTEGLTEELIRVLSRTPGLDVIARTSVMHYGQGDRALDEIAEEVGVGRIVEGSVNRTEERLRVTVRLVGAGSERNLWSQEWDRGMEDVFTIQSEIARGVASALKVDLPDDRDELLHREPTGDLAAYDSYLLGRHYLALPEDDGLRAAVEHFEAALDRDSALALAWSGLADCHVQRLVRHRSLPTDQSAQRAREAAEEALGIDDRLADPYVSLGYVATTRWQWRAAEAAFERALELAPSNAGAYRWYANLCLMKGDFERARERMERARSLDPLCDDILDESGWPFMHLGRMEEAAERSREVVNRNPESAMAFFNLGVYAERSGRTEEAVTLYRAASELSARIPFFSAFLGMALATIGDREEAETIARDLERKATRGTPVATCLGALFIRLGQAEDGLLWLEKAFAAKEPHALRMDTHWLPLPEVREDPRFRKLLEEAPRPSMIGQRP